MQLTTGKTVITGIWVCGRCGVAGASYTEQPDSIKVSCLKCLGTIAILYGPIVVTANGLEVDQR